ncbi:MAG: hypothetical protein PUB21_10555 [Bacteroidales bacterium]|nr:hypothetical protein [Bacteroidales bacterium]
MIFERNVEYTFTLPDRELNLLEYKKITNFFFKLRSSRYPPFRNLIFRGESISNLERKLGIDKDVAFYTNLSYFIFNIGDKGRVYQEEYRKQIPTKKIHSINCSDTEFLGYIFEKFKKIFKESKNEEVCSFIEKDEAFVSFFRKKENRETFISNIQGQNKDEQLLIRDYYLSILHKIGRIGFYKNSFFVSTTLQKGVAEKFTTNSDIIFVSWILPNKKNEPESILKKLSLPVSDSSIYSYQEEVTIKGGILPHFLIGYIKRENNEFVINPHFFETQEPLDKIIRGGIPIDQSNFRDILSQTNYRGFFVVGNEEDYRDFSCC